MRPYKGKTETSVQYSKAKQWWGNRGVKMKEKNGNFKMRDSRPFRQKEKLQVIAKNTLLKIFPDSKQKSRFLTKESNLNTLRVLAKKHNIMKTNSHVLPDFTVLQSRSKEETRLSQRHTAAANTMPGFPSSKKDLQFYLE